MIAVAREGSPSSKVCAFCKSWYDPTNSAIKPKTGKGFWEFDTKIKCKCRERNVITRAIQTCSKYEAKI